MYLKVPAAVYFDDYPMFSPEQTAQETDTLVSDFRDLLGWRHDRTGPKGKPFAQSFDVLGLTLDLSGLRNNHSVILKNKEGRVDKISSKILKIKEVGVMSLSDVRTPPERRIQTLFKKGRILAWPKLAALCFAMTVADLSLSRTFLVAVKPKHSFYRLLSTLFKVVCERVTVTPARDTF